MLPFLYADLFLTGTEERFRRDQAGQRPAAAPPPAGCLCRLLWPQQNPRPAGFYYRLPAANGARGQGAENENFRKNHPEIIDKNDGKNLNIMPKLGKTHKAD